MGYFYVNQVVYGGYLDKPAAVFRTKNGQEAWCFSIKVKKADNIYGYVSCMVYNAHLMDITEQYMIEANVGKRLLVSGETGFASKSQAVILLLGSVTFVDDFIDREELERRQANMPDFSDD